MAGTRPHGLKIDFMRNSISGSAGCFLVIILRFIFTLIFEIEIHEKYSLTPKKFHFWRSMFLNNSIRRLYKKIKQEFFKQVVKNFP